MLSTCVPSLTLYFGNVCLPEQFSLIVPDVKPASLCFGLFHLAKVNEYMYISGFFAVQSSVIIFENTQGSG